MIDFLLEIGFEEFPPSFLPKAAADLANSIKELLKKERIFYRTIRPVYTARRLGTLILGLKRKQGPQVIEIQGPPVKFAYDENGKPTEMLMGFLHSQNLKQSEIKIIKTPKGEYVVGKKEVAGKETVEILYHEIPKIIASLEFDKTMVWNETGVRFPRPVRWIVALLDCRPLRFKFAGVLADRYSMPNYHFSFKPVRLEKPREYLTFLRHGGVIVDPNERRKIILKQINHTANTLTGRPVYDNEMIEQINCTVEYPTIVVGEFDAKFLELPVEVLKTALRAHGNLIWLESTNKFICICSAKKKAAKSISQGYTNVLKARLEDALFYYRNDLKQGIEKMHKETRGMIWLKELGTIYDKTERLTKFVEAFADIPGIDMSALKRGATLCKADLVSQMVREKEFTSLQGIMGYYYTTAHREDEKIAIAIKEHYQPRFIGDEMPKTKEGAVLSIADKIDNIVGAFLTGQRPSGSYDPLAVRRNGYGVINILDAHSFNIDLFEIVNKLVKLYGKDLDLSLIREFFKERLSRYLEDKGFRYDEINAVLANTDGNVYAARLRCEGLKALRGREEFTRLVIGQKRVGNILKGISNPGEVDQELLNQAAEKSLYEMGQRVQVRLATLVSAQKYAEILELLLEMRPYIDKFFDDVLVMCEDKKIRKNRLALLDFINHLFLKFADLSQIVIEAEKV